MKFRPCIDIHNGKVKQIVGGSLKDQGNQANENFVSEQDASYYAQLYEEKGITGGFQNDPDLKDRIYAITLDSSTYGTDQASGNPVLELLDDATYDKDNLHAAIAIEIDIETGEAYSAFYGTKCAGLNYD